MSRRTTKQRTDDPCSCGRKRIRKGLAFVMEGFAMEHWRHVCGLFGKVSPPAARPSRRAGGEP